jgi:GrpE
MSATNGEQESKEGYACRYAELGRERWEGSESEDEEHAFDGFFDQRPGHYIHHMIDRIDGLKGSVRNASADVRERDIALGKLADTILDVSGEVSQILAKLAETKTAGDKAIMKKLRQVETVLSQSFENAGLESFGSIGDAFDPTIHTPTADGQAAAASGVSSSGRVDQVAKMGFKLKNRVVRRAEVVVAADPSSLESKPKAKRRKKK